MDLCSCLILDLHRTPEGLETDLRRKDGQSRDYSGVGLQGRMFLLSYSPECYKLLLNTRNNSPLKSTSFTTAFIGWLLLRSRVFANWSMASYVTRHGRKSVANHSWNFISCNPLPSDTSNSRRSCPGRRSVANRSHSIAQHRAPVCRGAIASHSCYLANYKLFVYSYVSRSPTSM